VPSGASVYLPDRLLDVGELGHGHLKLRLVRLIGGAYRVVHTGRGGHFDVAAEDVADRMCPGEGHQPVDGGGEGGPVPDVELAWIAARSRRPDDMDNRFIMSILLSKSLEMDKIEPVP
jgi:hypothetical protein